jgi:demethylmenaquinone methyltransferase/2-methoxy-6-polyprenyl-1,4-benzoquinol methylase
MKRMAQQSIEKAPWLAKGNEKRAALARLFGEIAPVYDRMNSLISLAGHSRWRRLAVGVLELRAGERVLDVCCGTGDFVPPLQRAVGLDGLVLGVDLCRPMLDIARGKLRPARLALADACALPIPDSSVDAVTFGWGLRNVSDLEAALQEGVRVLRPGGKLLSLDTAIPSSGLVRAMSRGFTRLVIPFLGALHGRGRQYAYLVQSKERFDGREGLMLAMRRAGLEDVRFMDVCFGNNCVVWGVKP